MSRLRVINLGLPKSGTTTLGIALRAAGLTVADHRIRRSQTNDPHLAGTFVARQLYEGLFRAGDPLEFLNGFDALTEISVINQSLSLWPQTDWGIIEAIRRHHPGARFLCSHREARKLSGSMLRWTNLGISRLPQGAVPGLPSGFGETSLQRITWIEGHYAHMRQLFKGAEDFLEYDIEDPEAPAHIGAFLGLTLPGWGKSNVNDALPEFGPV
jgi:hypothetical protein